MQGLRKRVAALVLALAMLITVLPGMSVSASEADGLPGQTEITTEDLLAADPTGQQTGDGGEGDPLGQEPQEPGAPGDDGSGELTTNPDDPDGRENPDDPDDPDNPENAKTPVDTVLDTIETFSGPVTSTASYAGGAVETYNTSKGEEFQMFVPDVVKNTAFIPSVIFHLDNGETVDGAIADYKLDELAEKYRIMISFAYPQNDGEWSEEDLGYLDRINLTLSAKAKPMQNTHRTLRYAIGNGAGATILNEYVVTETVYYGAVLTFGGDLGDARVPFVGVMPAWLVDADEETVEAYARSNSVRAPSTGEYMNPGKAVNTSNAAQQLWVSEGADDADKMAEIIDEAYYDMMRRTRRWATTRYGVVTVIPVDDYGFESYLDSDAYKPGSTPREWHEAVPDAARAKMDAGEAVPLLIACHGGSTMALYCSEQTQWHVVADNEEDPFVVVYPQGINNSWGMDNDEEFLLDLIDYLSNKYNIDTTRIYMSGFSMGSLMTQNMAANHPDLFAAIAPLAYIKVDETEVTEQNKNNDMLLPVYMVIGTEDYTLPMGDEDYGMSVVESKTAQSSIDYFLQFNGIATQEYDATREWFLGIVGDRVDRWGTDQPEDPAEGRFTTHAFYADGDPAKDYFYFTYVQDLDHSCDLRTAPAAWEYISRFSRLEDGTLVDSKNGSVSEPGGGALETYTTSEGEEFRMYVPDVVRGTAFIPSVIFHLDNNETVDQAIENYKLDELAQKYGVLVSIVYPQNGSEWSESDLGYLDRVNLTLSAKAYPMQNTHRTLRYAIGNGAGATILNKYVAAETKYYGAVLTFGGDLGGASVPFVGVMPAWLVDAQGDVIDAYAKSNGVSAPTAGDYMTPGKSVHSNNAAQQLWVSEGADDTGKMAEIVDKAYYDMMRRTRRWTTTRYGDVTVIPVDDYGFESFVDSDAYKLGATPREWHEAVPDAARAKMDAGEAVPLLISCHGVNTTALYNSEQTQWHITANNEDDPFVVVYLQGIGNSWNLNVDEQFILDIIEYMNGKYNIDSTRIYMSGFSMGAMMTQVMGALHPDVIAAIAPFGAFNINPILGVDNQRMVSMQESDYIMPVWGALGTADGAILAENAANQVGVDYYLKYNGIATQEYDTANESYLGIVPDISWKWGNDKATDPAEGRFTTNGFYVDGDPAKDYYYFTYVDELDHSCDLRTAPAAWEYISRFSRLKNGTLVDAKNPTATSSSTGGNRGGGNGGSSGWTPPSTAIINSGIATAVSANVNPDGTVNQTIVAADAATALSAVGTGGAASIQVRNAQSISAAALNALANAADAAGKTLILHADTMTASGQAVQGRLYVEVESISSDLQLGVFTEGEPVAATASTFARWFSNRIAVVNMTHRGMLGARLRVAARVDLSGMDVTALQFYAYDQTDNTYRMLTDTEYSIDANGYLHFYVEQGGDIVISEGVFANR